MASQSVARSESIAAFIPALELIIAEAMDEWKIPGLAVAVVQNGELALVRAYGFRDVELKYAQHIHPLPGEMMLSTTRLSAGTAATGNLPHLSFGRGHSLHIAHSRGKLPALAILVTA